MRTLSAVILSAAKDLRIPTPQQDAEILRYAQDDNDVQGAIV
jgi:hypothetical protein